EIHKGHRYAPPAAGGFRRGYCICQRTFCNLLKSLNKAEKNALKRFVRLWNKEIQATATASMKRRSRRLTTKQEAESQAWRRKIARENPKLYPKDSDLVVAHVPDAVWGGKHKNGTHMPLPSSLNEAIGSIAQNVTKGTIYHRVRVGS
ncbi:MAG TPA: hypothetical protein VEL76_12215, partial [Gemmataceae bacterium]|nr:hypothetical protein [Gemmataceae bacterium]